MGVIINGLSTFNDKLAQSITRDIASF